MNAEQRRAAKDKELSYLCMVR